MIRTELSNASAMVAIEHDNPTLKGATGPGPIYALGLRNPGGLAFHPETGACYVADAGDRDEVGHCFASVTTLPPSLTH